MSTERRERRGPLGRLWSRLTSAGSGPASIHVGEPEYDRWEVIEDFEGAETARAFLQTVTEAGVEAVLTSDWPLDRFGRGDIALRVPPSERDEAEELLAGQDLE